MPRKSFPKVVDQVVEHLRNGIQTGRWRGCLPGRDRLAEELGVSHTTMEAAMRRLSKEGLLASAGPGRRRRIVLDEQKITPKHFRVRFLAYESIDRNLPHVIHLMDQLKKAGFTADFTLKSLLDLGMDAKRVARYVQKHPADAWIVFAGSREVIEWFCQQPVPAYAYFGNKSDLPIAGCGVRIDIQPIIRMLHDAGHRRIVLLTREDNLMPKPGYFVRTFLEALRQVGIEPGSYHLPVWGYRPEGLHRCLESLFKVSPPTTLIATEPHILHAARDHLSRRGIIPPRDVSLICLDHGPSFDWLDPKVDHCRWDHLPITRHLLKWIKKESLGNHDTHQYVAMARYVNGGSAGQAPETKARA